MMKRIGLILGLMVAAPNLAFAQVTVGGPEPGVPVAGTPIAGGPVTQIVEGGGVGAQPITIFGPAGGETISTYAGDVVFLKDADAGDSASNFDAVLRFFNPADPTGSQGLAATEYETFFGGNVAPDTFSSLQLLPTVFYLPEASSSSVAAVAEYDDFGPAGAVSAGQLALVTLIATPQPNSPLGGGGGMTAAAPEPASWILLILGLGALGSALRRARRHTAVATAV